MGVEVGKDAVSGTISMSSDTSSRTMVLSNPNLSSIYLYASFWSISKEIEGLL